MSPERWKRVQELAASALELQSSELVPYLKAQVGSDEQLAEDVLNLIRNTSGPDLPILKTGACAIGLNRVFDASPALEPDLVLCGRFAVTDFIDAGGMGEVYSAWDRELGCAVALKTIRGQVGRAALDRFRKEVVRARQISHPNICRVYDLFQDDRAGVRTHFLTMELLHGSNLAQYIQHHGKLRTPRALVILTQIAEGLSAAHRQGIIHRDLKPGNVMIVDEESGTRAAITDFGLALPLAGLEEDTSSVHASGTVPYMAPEQLKNGIVSPASDVYAFGVLARTILQESALPDRIASSGQTWKEFIARCTEPDPRKRIPNGVVLRDELAHRRTSRSLVYAAAAVVPLSIASAIMISYALRDRNLKVEESIRLSEYSGLATSGAVSDNGSIVAYASDEAEPGNLDIWVRDLNTGVSRRVTSDPSEELSPELSPDGRWVVYRSERNGGGLYAAPVQGGQEFLVAPRGRDAVFSPDGKRIAFWIGDKMNLSVNGSIAFVMDFPDGVPQPLHPEFADARLPVWSPDGRSILFLGVKEGELPPDAAGDWWVTSLDSRELRPTGLQPLLRQQKLLLHNGVLWWRNYLIFAATQGDATNIWYSTLNRGGRAGSSFKRLTTSTDNHFVPSIARGGRLLYSTLRAQIGTLEIDTNEPGREPRFVTSSVGNDTYTSLSTDGLALVFRRRIYGFRNVWLKDLRTGHELALTNSPTEKLQPAISPNGSVVAWSQAEGRTHSVFLTRVADRQTIPLCQSCGDVQGWMPDGDRVITASGLDGTARSVSVKTSRQEPLLDNPDYIIDSVRCSPDGRRLVFVGRRDDAAAIYTVAANSLGRTARPNPVRLSGAASWSDAPAWSTDGGTIFFRSNLDGHFCVWSVALPKLPGQSAPPPRIVRHFHSYQSHLDAFSRSAFAISVWNQRMYLTGADMRGTVWMTRVRDP